MCYFIITKLFFPLHNSAVLITLLVPYLPDLEPFTKFPDLEPFNHSSACSPSKFPAFLNRSWTKLSNLYRIPGFFYNTVWNQFHPLILLAVLVRHCDSHWQSPVPTGFSHSLKSGSHWPGSCASTHAGPDSPARRKGSCCHHSPAPSPVREDLIIHRCLDGFRTMSGLVCCFLTNSPVWLFKGTCYNNTICVHLYMTQRKYQIIGQIYTTDDYTTDSLSRYSILNIDSTMCKQHFVVVAETEFIYFMSSLVKWFPT